MIWSITLRQGSQTQILSWAALAIKNVLQAAHWRKNGSAGRSSYKKALKGHNLFIFMALFTTFLPKQHKNSNISIKILITYIFWEGRGPHRHPWRATCCPRVWDPCFKGISTNDVKQFWTIFSPLFPNFCVLVLSTGNVVKKF